MAVDIKYYITFVISVTLLNICTTSANKPCLFKVNSTADIDISKLATGKQLQASYGVFLFLFSPCNNINFDKLTSCTNATLCLQNTNDTKDNGKVLGNALWFKFKSENHKNQLIFKSQDEIETTINLVCTPNELESYFVAKSKNDKTNELFLMSDQACLMIYNHNSSLSNGSVFLILLFVGFIIYMVGGACVLYTLRGARGLEMIPNIDFWKGLPSLVRDGFLYLMNGCTLPTTVTTTAETYDRI